MKYIIEYNGFLQTIRREFKTSEEAYMWLQKIGKKDVKIKENASE